MLSSYVVGHALQHLLQILSAFVLKHARCGVSCVDSNDLIVSDKSIVEACLRFRMRIVSDLPNLSQFSSCCLNCDGVYLTQEVLLSRGPSGKMTLVMGNEKSRIPTIFGEFSSTCAHGRLWNLVSLLYCLGVFDCSDRYRSSVLDNLPASVGVVYRQIKDMMLTLGNPETLGVQSKWRLMRLGFVWLRQ